MRTRRQWLKSAAFWVASPAIQAARREFWETKDPANWNNTDKLILLGRSPWAREGFARMDDKQDPTAGYGNDGTQQVEMPVSRPAVPPEGVQSVPIGQPVPPVPRADGKAVQFRVLARWETAKPVRLAGGPEVPELTGQFYVIRLRGLPLMPPLKSKPGEPPPPDPNLGMLQAIKAGTRLERSDNPPIPCAHLFTGTGNTATDVLLFFSRVQNPITIADKVVTLESRFAAFHLSIKFPLKEMIYRGELAL
jgi:hypothetical protein